MLVMMIMIVMMTMMISLAMHEANPGHHLQSSYQIEAENFPTFRKVMEDRIYSQSPSR